VTKKIVKKHTLSVVFLAKKFVNFPASQRSSAMSVWAKGIRLQKCLSIRTAKSLVTQGGKASVRKKTSDKLFWNCQSFLRLTNILQQ
jgi:hypothetical protein